MLVVDTDYNNWAVMYQFNLDFFELFSVEDVVIASKNSVNYNMNSLSMQQAINVVKQKLPRIDLYSMASP